MKYIDKIKKFLPMGPKEGPPLPRVLNQKWPWQEGGDLFTLQYLEGGKWKTWLPEPAPWEGKPFKEEYPEVVVWEGIIELSPEHEIRILPVKRS